jgi:Holliday junction DNA helicase RuvA
MIDFICGKIIKKNPTKIVLNTNGIGYSINISSNTYEYLPEIGSEINLKTYLHVREDNIQLFGFWEEQERMIFMSLISISGVGPRLAQTILSGIRVNDLITAIKEGGLNKLTAISGVGRKTAQRLILELKEKFLQIGIIKDQSKEDTQPVFDLNKEETEAVSALISLGYKKQTAEEAVLRIKDQNDHYTVEDLIRKVLQHI